MVIRECRRECLTAHSGHAELRDDEVDVTEDRFRNVERLTRVRRTDDPEAVRLEGRSDSLTVITPRIDD
jgi:hypothetical protein